MTAIVPINTTFLARHNLVGTPMVVAADDRMLSRSNLRALGELDMSFIVGSRVSKAARDLESDVFWDGDVFIDSQIIDTGTPRRRQG